MHNQANITSLTQKMNIFCQSKIRIIYFTEKIYDLRTRQMPEPESLIVASSLSTRTPSLSPLLDSIFNADITCTECPPSETQKICVSAQTL
jgi:hypothetical protein